MGPPRTIIASAVLLVGCTTASPDLHGTMSPSCVISVSLRDSCATSLSVLPSGEGASAQDLGVADAPADDLASAPPDLTTPFSLGDVQIINAPADVATWPITTQITQLDLQASGAKITFSKKGSTCDPNGMTTSPGSWPDVPYGNEGGLIEYTLWLIERINGTWYASGGIEYWCGWDRYPGLPSGFGTGWFYDPGRWGVMANRTPAVGEIVGFMVTQGDARNNGYSSLKERSNVVFVPFPSDAAGGIYNF